MTDGPTAQGSIVAYIGAEDSDYQAKMAQAQATAEKLAETDPTVTVHADTGEALAKIAAVREAAQSMQDDFDAYSVGQRGTSMQSDLAALKQQIRDVQLPQTYYTNDLATAQSRLAAAKRAVASADRDLFNADVTVQGLMEKQSPVLSDLRKGYDDLTGASIRYKDAQAALAAAEAGVADIGGLVPPDRGNGGGGPSGGAAGATGHLSYGAAIAAGIATIAPMAADLAGTVAGLTGAFAGMGAAGLLAVGGIKAEMVAGTIQGDQYAGLLQILKGDLDTLEQTAASGILKSFSTAVQTIDAAMPSLNNEVAGLSQGLGQVAGTTLDGVTSGFRTVNPLINEAQTYVEGLATDWDRWVHDGGLAQWTADAQRSFPLVTDTIGTLGHTILQLLGDLAPVGTGMFQMIDSAAHAADVLAKVLGPSIQGVGNLLTWLGGPLTAGAASALLVALNMGKIAPVLDKLTFGLTDLANVQAATTAKQEAYTAALAAGATAEDAAAAGAEAFQAASGPVGLTIGVAALAVGGLVAALSGATSGTQDATAAEQSYAQALQASNGVLNESVRQTVAENLAKTDAFSIANEYGVSLSTLTSAAMGNKTAMDAVNATLNQNAMVTFREGVRGTGTQVTRLSGSALELKKIIGDTNGDLSKEVDQYKAQQSAMGDSVTTTGQLTAAMSAAADASNALQTALSNLGSVNMSEAQAQIAYKQSVADTTATIQKNGATLNENTQKGRDNNTALLNLAKSSVALVAAEQQQGASEKTLQATMQQSRDAFIKSAMAAGDTRQEAAKLADQYGLIPKKVGTLFATSGVGQALQNIYAVKLALGQIPHQVEVHFSSNAADIGIASGKISAIARASGGPVYAAAGAFMPQGTDTVAAMLTPGEFVVKQKSAAYDPQFLKAYNADPQKALANAGTGGSSTPTTLVVVDADGALIGRMRVEASSVALKQSAGRTASLMAGRRA